MNRAHQMDKLADIFLAEGRRSTFASDSSYCITRQRPLRQPRSPPKHISNRSQNLNKSIFVMPRLDLTNCKSGLNSSSSISDLELPEPEGINPLLCRRIAPNPLSSNISDSNAQSLSAIRLRSESCTRTVHPVRKRTTRRIVVAYGTPRKSRV